MALKRYVNQTLTNEVFDIEECWFVNCVLKQCTLSYSGGSWDLENTKLENCQWKFRDSAQRTCQLLSQIGLLPPPMNALQQFRSPQQPN
jgi:hypothetical protein